jgi:hypothetical protein
MVLRRSEEPTVTNSINSLVATAHISDLRETADRRRRVAGHLRPVAATKPPAPAVVLRPADVGDAPATRRVAALDDAPPLDGPALLALIDDEVVAALSLRDGRVIANPFVPTSQAVALLRLRAEHLSGWKQRSRRRISLRPHFA